VTFIYRLIGIYDHVTMLLYIETVCCYWQH